MVHKLSLDICHLLPTDYSYNYVLIVYYDLSVFCVLLLFFFSLNISVLLPHVNKHSHKQTALLETTLIKTWSEFYS